MIRKLRRKFVAIVMGASAVILCAVFAVLVVTTQTGLVRQSNEMLEAALSNEGRWGNKDFREGRDFSLDLGPDDFDEKDFDEDDWDEGDRPDPPPEGFQEGMTPPDGQRPDDLPQDLFQGRSLVVTATVTEDGTVTWEDRAQFLLGDSDEDDLDALAQAAAASQEDTGTSDPHQLRWMKRDTDDGVLIAFADTSQESNSLMELVKNILLVGALTLVALFGASILLARWAVKPVETAWTQQKQFVGDASHELKTPLTVILSNADMILTHPGEDGSRWAENIQAEGQRMKELVQQLLSLARSDDGASQPVFETVDLSYLCTDSVLAFEPVAFEGGHELFYEVEPDVTLQGDKSGLTQLCGILLDNAQKYASPGGRIWLTLTSDRRNARLSVTNEGEAIPSEDLTRIFERFYRADPSRHGEGHGLGLAIARRVAEQHKGRIWAESGPGKNTFIVTLPLTKK